MTAQPLAAGDLFARHQTITGLRALADFLETNPGVPVADHGREYTLYTQTGTDEHGRALVDHVAALLGGDVRDDTGRGGHYTVRRRFGRITYQVVHVSAHAVAAFDARNSYAPNIVLDPDQGDQGDQAMTSEAA